MHRHGRQIRLADVGTEGQARIARAVVNVPGRGLAAHVAARYLAGAGVSAIRVEDEATAAAARAVDPSVCVTVDEEVPDAEAAVADGLTDPSARSVAAGALFALSALRAALASEPS